MSVSELSTSVHERERWRGCFTIAASLLGLAMCVCLATGVTFIDRFPTQLDRYIPLEIGQASLYRVTYADGSQGFLSTNVAVPNPDSLSYALVYGNGGKAIQIHSIFTNWQGSGETFTRDDFYARNGDLLVQVASQEPDGAFVADPPLPVWSPEIAASSRNAPRTGQMVTNGNRFTYRIWSEGEQQVTLPHGESATAMLIETELSFQNAAASQTKTWYAPDIGIVRQEDYDGEGQFIQGIELIASSTLPGPAPNLPLAELLAGESQTTAFFRENAARTGAHPQAVLPDPNLKIAYSFSPPSGSSFGFTASPTYADGLLYVADQSGRLTVLDAQQATVRWTFSAGGPIVAAPAVANGVVYIGAADKNLYALDAQHGLFLWRFRLLDNVATSPVVADGMLFVGGEDRTLYALDPLTGAEQWRFVAGDRIISSPAAVAGRVYFGADDSVVYALDAATGDVLWRRALDAYVVASVAVSDDGIVYAASTGTQLAALDAATGEMLWSYESRLGYLGSPALGEQLVFVADTDGDIRALDRLSGELAWEWHSKYGIYFSGSPLLLGDTLIAVDSEGTLHVLAAADGQELHQLSLAGNVTASPTWGAETVFVATQAGQLMALRSGEGVVSVAFAPVWDRIYGDELLNFEETIPGAAPIFFDGNLYAVLFTGDLWEINGENGAGERIAQFGEAIESTPARFASALYIGTDSGSVLAYDMDQRETLWRAQIDGAVRFTPAVDAERVYVHSQLDARGKIYALDAADGTVVWEQFTGLGSSSPLLADGALFVGSGAIQALDPVTGAERWQSTPFQVFGSLAVYNGVVYAGGAGSDDVTFMALDADTGETLWTSSEPVLFVQNQPAYDPDNGAIIVGAQDGGLYAFDADSGALRWRFEADAAIQSNVQIVDGAAIFNSFNGTLYAVNTQSGVLLADYRQGIPMDTYGGLSVQPGRVYGVHGNTFYAVDLQR